MSYRIGLVGSENTGKSFSRSFIKHPEEIFVAQPSVKALHFKINGKHPPKLNIAKDEFKTTDALLKSLGLPLESNLVTNIIQGIESNRDIKGLTITGNYALTQDLATVQYYLKLIHYRMPQIKLAILPDFTHYLSTLIGSDEFIGRKEGGEAYQRYLDLAAAVLKNFFTVVDTLREDLIVITEYHSEFDPFDDKHILFVNGGKMVREKFRPASYYDTLLYSAYIDDETKPYEDRFKFITRHYKKYDARSLPGCFADELIPNNLQTVVDTMKNYLGLV